MMTAWPSFAVRGLSPRDAMEQIALDGRDVFPVGARVAQRARAELQRSGYRSLAQVECVFARGVLTLWGRVPSYYVKQIAQTVVRGVEQVEEIVNRIEVDPPEK